MILATLMILGAFDLYNPAERIQRVISLTRAFDSTLGVIVNFFLSLRMAASLFRSFVF
jgi:hypothetical protein